jgi:hypothetical protein
VLRFELEPDGDGTLLTLDHRGLHTDGTGYGAGWHAHVDCLEAEAAGTERPSWSASFDAALPEFQKLSPVGA